MYLTITCHVTHQMEGVMAITVLSPGFECGLWEPTSLCHRQGTMPFIILTSQWPRWRLKSPASRSYTQSFIRAQIKENIKAPRNWPLCGEFAGTGEFPAQRASNAENVSIWWRHHVLFDMCVLIMAIQCVTHVSWWMSWSLIRASGENVPGIPGACAPAILLIW